MTLSELIDMAVLAEIASRNLDESGQLQAMPFLREMAATDPAMLLRMGRAVTRTELANMPAKQALERLTAGMLSYLDGAAEEAQALAADLHTLTAQLNGIAQGASAPE